MNDQTECAWPVHRFAMAMLRRFYYEAQGGQCGICRALMKRNFHSTKLNFDHVWPKAWASHRGGPEAMLFGNILLAHSSCNDAKADSKPDADEIAFLYAVNRKLNLPPWQTAVWDQPE